MKQREAPARCNIKLGFISLIDYFKTKFEGIIYTADESGAGTDAKVEIWFTDLDGQVVGPLMITEVNGDTMERGHQNNITVELVEKLNGLAKIQLRQVSS